MLPVHYMFDDWFNGGKPWWEQYGELWGGIIEAIVSDLLGALEAMWLDFIAADHWDEHAGEGTGRVFTNVVLTFTGGLGLVRILKSLKGMRGIRRISAAQQRLVDGLINEGVKISPEKVVTIMKTTDGRIVWLEEGAAGAGVKRPSGLAHIIEGHGDEFAKKGISDAEIPDVLTRALQQGKIGGFLGKGTEGLSMSSSTKVRL